MRGLAKIILRFMITLAFPAAIVAALAACPMSGGYGMGGGYTGGSMSGPPYTVTYVNTTIATSGTVPVDSTKYAAGATVTVMGNTGNLSWGSTYTFKGWNTLDYGTDGGGGGGTFYAPGATFTINSNVVLYGQWTP